MIAEFGDYRIIEKIGEGGMGEVYKGLDIMLDREIAIKLLRPELSQRPDLVERFRSEAKALARLNHPNIATLYSFTRFNDQYCMVLEFLHGETLDCLLARRSLLDWPDAVRLLSHALKGLDHAHRMGIVHRDVKPSNLMLTPSGEVKLMDFGIARILQTARLTSTDHTIGTLEYMSPEQIQGQETDARSDIYSVGVVLYEMVTGKLPFDSTNDFELRKSHVERMPQAPSTLYSGIPAGLNDAIMHALAKDPRDRFSSASEFIQALETITNSSNANTSPATRLFVEGRPTNISDHQGNPNHLPQKASLWRSYPGPMALAVVLVILGGWAVYRTVTVTRETPNKPLIVQQPVQQPQEISYSGGYSPPSIQPPAIILSPEQEIPVIPIKTQPPKQSKPRTPPKEKPNYTIISHPPP